MTRRLTTAISILGFCLILSHNAFAQIQDHLELNVFGAGSIYTTNKYQIGYPQSVTPIPGELKLDEGVRFGTRLGVYTRGHWGQEFYYSFENTGVTIANGGASPTVTSFRVRVHNYGVNALYYFTETESNVFQPFASAGLGGTAYQIRQESLSSLRNPAQGNLPDVNNSNELTFNYGFGFKTRSAGWLGIRMDIRDYVSRTPSFGLVRQSIDPTAAVLPATGPLNNLELSLGLTFYFGKR